MVDDRIPKIVLTGGPCAGKTSVLNFLAQKLGEMGYLVFAVPEAATILQIGAVKPQGVGLEGPEFQTAVLKLVLALEDQFMDLAKLVAGRDLPVVIICDRGALDGLAYVDPVRFEEIARAQGFSIGELRGSRYDGVIHLRSAAVGVETAYNLDNLARTETLEQARARDEAVCRAWCGHSHLRIVPALPDFGQKRQQVLAEVCSILGIPLPFELNGHS
jgi:predicted ATPase